VKWTARTSGTTNDLNSVFGTSDGKGLWVVGRRGTILESRDGAPWTARTSPTTSYLQSVFGTSDGKRLWAVGYEGTILESRDGAQWTTARTSGGTTNDLNSVFGTSDGKGLWVVGRRGTILESSDTTATSPQVFSLPAPLTSLRNTPWRLSSVLRTSPVRMPPPATAR
jgi:photosystem II stability/assembly factor-like uncharacterized protein